MNKILFLLFLLFPAWSFANFEKLKKSEIEIKWKYYSGDYFYKKLEKSFENKYKYDYEKKKLKYINLISKVKNIKNENNFENIEYILEVLDYGLNKTKQGLITNEIIIWKSVNWKEIKAYYRWDLDKWFYWIFANIHWWYEYWTYETAIYLKKEFENSGKSWWFIIPTINPDWLDFKWLYKWRFNSNGINLNRNFCTKIFIENKWDYWCNTEAETKNITHLIKKYKFNKIISLHSEWWLFFIPDGSFDDKRVIKLWKELLKILPNYEFDVDYNSEYEKNDKIFRYEIEEWWKQNYIWTMETYLYEQLDIPVILIELMEHWLIEKKLNLILE